MEGLIWLYLAEADTDGTFTGFCKDFGDTFGLFLQGFGAWELKGFRPSEPTSEKQWDFKGLGLGHE